MPNIPETVVAFLAAASIGAIWSSCSPDFGAGSVIDRFAQIEPKVLLAVDGYRYGGKDFDRTGVVEHLLAEMPTVEHTVSVPYLSPAPDTSGLRNPIAWEELLESGAGAALEFEQLPFDHPLWVLYSSGTTGLPKAIVQGHGGILLEQLKKLHLHLDAREGDRVFWFTTTGWMMWNFLVGVLHTDASIVLYDGNPGHPDMDVLWQLAADAADHHLRHQRLLHRRLHEGRTLSRAQAATSRRSPPSARPARRSPPRASSGSTTTSARTPGCSRPRAEPTSAPRSSAASRPLPVYRGELQARSLGCAVEAWNEDGEPVVDEVGELVITEPMPSMPIFFWGDEDGSRYRESYFEMFPGVWRHGDWIEITSRGTAIIYGRSDSTINRSGVRMGTSEIYRAVSSLDEITDALVVDIPRPGTEGWMPLFVVLREGAELDDDLRREIARRIREQCSPRHVPNEVYAVAEVPRTLSGKVLEVPVKRILMGTPVDAGRVEGLAREPGVARPVRRDGGRARARVGVGRQPGPRRIPR